MFGVSMPWLVICFLINTWAKGSRREWDPGPSHAMYACFMIPLEPEFGHACRSPPAACVHTGNAAMLSVFHFVELCSKCEAGFVHPSLWTETAVFCPEVSSVNGQPHYRQINSRLFGRKKKIYLNKSIKTVSFLDRGWMVFILNG